MTTIAVTGATGYVGRFVVTELHRRGMQVRALSPSHMNGLPLYPEMERGSGGEDFRSLPLLAGEGLGLGVEFVPQPEKSASC